MSATVTLDYFYLRNIQGILKICCLLGSLIGFICIAIGGFTVHLHNFRGLFYIVTAALGFIGTGCVLAARVFQLWKYKFYHFEVIKYEMYLHSGLAVAFFCASSLALSLAVITYSIAAFFGYLTAIFYASDAYLCYRRSRQRDAVTQT